MQLAVLGDLDFSAKPFLNGMSEWLADIA